MKKVTEEMQKIVDRIQELINEGNLRRIIIKDENGDLFMEIPLLVGVIGTIAAPYVTAIGILAGYAAKFSVELIKKESPEAKEIFLLNKYEDK